MQTYGPYYPSVVVGEGWTNPENATSEGDGAATWPDPNTGDLVGTGFGFTSAEIPDDKAIVQVILGVRAKADNDGLDPAIDRVQLILDGVSLGEVNGHGGGIGSSLEWYEFTLYQNDIEAIGLTPANVQSDSFGLVFSGYDRSASESGTCPVSVDAMRLTVTRED